MQHSYNVFTQILWFGIAEKLSLNGDMWLWLNKMSKSAIIFFIFLKLMKLTLRSGKQFSLTENLKETQNSGK